MKTKCRPHKSSLRSPKPDWNLKARFESELLIQRRWKHPRWKAKPLRSLGVKSQTHYSTIKSLHNTRAKLMKSSGTTRSSETMGLSEKIPRAPTANGLYIYIKKMTLTYKNWHKKFTARIQYFNPLVNKCNPVFFTLWDWSSLVHWIRNHIPASLDESWDRRSSMGPTKTRPA